jgi:hypothetical protein
MRIKKKSAFLLVVFTAVVVLPSVRVAALVVERSKNAKLQEEAHALAQAVQASNLKVEPIPEVPKPPAKTVAVPGAADAYASLPPQEETPVKASEETLISYHSLPAEDLPVDPKAQRCLGSLITTEAGNQSKLGRYAVGFTVPNRMKLNRCDFGGNTVCGIVNYKDGPRWQYDGMRHPPTQLLESTIENMNLAADILRGRVTPEGWLKRARYYKYPEYARGPGGKWFDKLVPLGVIGVHHFFDEDPNAEPPVCHPVVAHARKPHMRVAKHMATKSIFASAAPAKAAKPKLVHIQHKRLAKN